MSELVDASDERILRSTFGVYLSGKFLIYHKEGCRRAGLSPWFFLHITLVDEANVFACNALSRSVNKDFRVSSFVSGRNYTCKVKTRLPDHAIRCIRTGQHIPGKEMEIIYVTDRSGVEAAASENPQTVAACSDLGHARTQVSNPVPALKMAPFFALIPDAKHGAAPGHRPNRKGPLRRSPHRIPLSPRRAVPNRAAPLACPRPGGCLPWSRESAVPRHRRAVPSSLFWV